ncbi:MAG: translation initiation factor IF-2 subunit gamma, partial [Nitrososphaerota archaeon]
APPVWTSLTIEYQLFRKVLGVDGDVAVKPLTEKEPLVINVSSAVTSGVVTRRTQDRVELSLTRPVAAELGGRVTISRKIGTGWRLIGYASIVGG